MRRRDKLAEQIRRSTRRVETRHHRINDRLDQVETNTGRLDVLEEQLAGLTERVLTHLEDKKGHKP
jgi:hypothetical protein